MNSEHTDLEALAEAFEAFTRTTQSMEEAYRRLEQRIQELDRELADKNRELAFTSDYLSNLLESMTDGVLAIDTQGIIIRFNRAAGAMLGYSAEEVIGRAFNAVFEREFTAPKTTGAMGLRAKSGRVVPVGERDSEVCDNAGNRMGKVKTFQDLSELKALREQVRQMDRLAAIGEMAATVAHEIRNPLGGIRGFAGFLASDIAEDDPKRRLVNKIIEGTNSLDRVVNDLLEYTRPVELRLAPTSCAETVRAAVGFLKYDAEAIAIGVDIPDTVRVLADAEKMGQVFLNILLNAVQSIAETGSIRISAEVEDNHVTTTIADTGCGMAKEQLEKVFSPFYTTKEKGTGLGLAVCTKIVEGHGGAMEADSQPGEGTHIRVRLPRAE